MELKQHLMLHRLRKQAHLFILLLHKSSNMGNTAQTIAPTSGETEFNPQIDDIIEEAFERTGS